MCQCDIEHGIDIESLRIAAKLGCGESLELLQEKASAKVKALRVKG
mgnify:CR=1 FL=1